ncbi:formate dehydrogenase subunit gamma [Ferrovibrio sp.]|uniref:formate dehydrogenase subunit gamma n=1 Tax=Ferrovibrio sp. TaxID=1917215 RepID=UPI003D2CA04B
MYATWDPTRAGDIINHLRGLEGPLLPILHALQAAFGHVPKPALPLIAEALNISRAEVHGVVSFYHDFREQPAGRHVLKLCRAEACQSMGSEAMAKQFLDRLGLGWGETTRDGRLTVEATYCLGLCACAPAAMLDGEVVGRLDDARLDELAREARR